jgi:ferrous iron transport protein A
MTVAGDTESRLRQPSAGASPGGCRVTLATSAVGSLARVHDVHGDDAIALRLLEMGLTPGVAVRVVGRAPLGDPLELEVRGYRLSIRRAEAARVVVGLD